MIAYASRTGTRRNLDAMRAHGWRVLISAAGCLRSEGFQYGLDNGAWSAHQAGTVFDSDQFERALVAVGRGADWIVLPDIVMGGLPSLALSLEWLSLCRKMAPVLVPVQNGMTRLDVEPILADDVGIFVGGDTEWKESTLPTWGRLARDVGCHLHVGRVNTRRRIRLCKLSGVDSIDGTSVTRFAKNIHHLDAEVRQQAMVLL